MKNLKYILAFVAMAGALFTACNDTEFTPGPEAEGTSIYFSSEVADTQFNVGDDESSVVIPVMRIKAEEAQTVAILADAGEAADLFTIPSSITFAAGQTQYDLVIGFDRTALVDGEEYPIDLLINDDNITPYGRSTVSFTIAPWPWVELGKGKYRDDYISSLFDCEHVEIDIKVHEHKTNKGIYMIEEMFGWPYLTEVFEASQAQLSAQFSYKPTNIVIDASDPNNVVIDTQWTGIAEHIRDYGDFNIFSIDPGTLENGVITFPVKGLIIQLTGMGAYYANGDGMFRILLPGAEVTDYTLAAEYAGMKVAVDNTTSAMIDFAYGDDVQGIAYTFAAGDQEQNAAEYIEAMIAGTDENMAEVADFEAGAGSASIEAALETAGVYTVIAMPKDKNGEWVAAEAIAVSFYFPGLGAAESHPVEFEIYMGKVTENAPSYAEDYPDWAAIYYEFIGKDIKSVRYMLDTEDEYAMDVEDGLSEVLAKYGSDLSEKQLGYLAEDGYYANIFINLNPNTTYYLIAEVTNIYGEKDIFVESYTTAEEPAVDYNGELVIGDYLMYSPDGLINNDGSDKPSACAITIVPAGTSDNDFYIKNLGVNDNQLSWLATYDPDASTLTVDGLVKGDEASGSYFLACYAYYSKEDNLAYGLLCGDTGEDSLVINIDPTTKQPVTMNQDVAVFVANLSTGKIVGYLRYYTAANTTFSPYSEEASASTPLNNVVPFRPGMQPKHNGVVKASSKLNRLQPMDMTTVKVEKSNTSTPKAKTLAVKSATCERQAREYGKAQIKAEKAVRAFTK